MDMQTANRNLLISLLAQMRASKFTVFAVCRVVGSVGRLSNGIEPRNWHVVEIASTGNGLRIAPRATFDDCYNGVYDIDMCEFKGINMMGDVNVVHTWAATGRNTGPGARMESWLAAAGHAQGLNNGEPQITGWEAAAVAPTPKVAAPQVAPSNTAQSLADEILAREAVGTEKYGTTVDGNPLPAYAWHQHGVEEALDLAMYLRRSQADAQAAAAAVDTLFVLMDASGEELRDYLVQCNTPEDGERLRLALLTLRALFPSGA